jgi:transposase-like protein
MENPSSVRTDCPSCGTVELPIDDANLVLGFEQPGPEQVLRYRCPICRSERTENIGERATRLLMAAGIGLVGTPDRSPMSQDGRGSRASG